MFQNNAYLLYHVCLSSGNDLRTAEGIVMTFYMAEF
jgi:hypothetical protein